MVTAPYYPISPLLSVSGRLREVIKTKETFLALKVAVHGRLQEVVAYKRFPI